MLRSNGHPKAVVVRQHKADEGAQMQALKLLIKNTSYGKMAAGQGGHETLEEREKHATSARASIPKRH